MRDLILAIFGVYSPLLQPDGVSYVLGVAGVDWAWLAGVMLFALVLVSFSGFWGC